MRPIHGPRPADSLRSRHFVPDEMVRAGLTSEGLLFTFQVMLAASVLLTVVHIWGAVQKIQPLLETLEIGMYAGLAVLTLLFWPISVPPA